MESRKNSSLEYPVMLDVVIWKKDPYQVVGSAQTNSQKTDFFILQDTTPDSKPFRVKGAKFVSTITKDPPAGYVYKRDEGVRITGKLVGGRRQEP